MNAAAKNVNFKEKLMAKIKDFTPVTLIEYEWNIKAHIHCCDN